MHKPFRIFISIAGLLVLTGFVVLLYYDMHWLLAYFAAINFSTLLFYLYDKSISHTNLTRVPEVVLHTLALAGGSPAALLSQWLFRHKTRKTSFQIVYWFILLVQLALVAWAAYEGYLKILVDA